MPRKQKYDTGQDTLPCVFLAFLALWAMLMIVKKVNT